MEFLILIRSVISYIEHVYVTLKFDRHAQCISVTIKFKIVMEFENILHLTQLKMIANLKASNSLYYCRSLICNGTDQHITS